jgi:hypothetical protein
MKVIPAGASARILPKPGMSIHGSAPVYMMATTSTAGGQNVMRVARAVTTSPMTTSPQQFQGATAQRVVTVSSAALKTTATALGLRMAAPGTIVRTLQPRSAAAGQV